VAAAIPVFIDIVANFGPSPFSDEERLAYSILDMLLVKVGIREAARM
jgi:hypothetical protein